MRADRMVEHASIQALGSETLSTPYASWLADHEGEKKKPIRHGSPLVANPCRNGFRNRIAPVARAMGAGDRRDGHERVSS
jgi:hypothetical protein